MTNNKFVFKKDSKGELRWRKVSPNNVIIGASSEGFKTRQGVLKNAQLNGYSGTGKRMTFGKLK